MLCFVYYFQSLVNFASNNFTKIVVNYYNGTQYRQNTTVASGRDSACIANFDIARSLSASPPLSLSLGLPYFFLHLSTESKAAVLVTNYFPFCTLGLTISDSAKLVGHIARNLKICFNVESRPGSHWFIVYSLIKGFIAC